MSYVMTWHIHTPWSDHHVKPRNHLPSQSYCSVTDHIPCVMSHSQGIWIVSQMTQRLTSHPIPKSDKVIPEAVPYKGSFTDPQGCLCHFFFFCFWLCWISVAVCGASSSCGKRGLLFAVVWALIAVASRCRTQAVGTWASAAAAWGLSNSGSRTLGHWLSTCGAQGWLALWHVGSFLTWDGTHDPCTGRQTLNH